MAIVVALGLQAVVIQPAPRQALAAEDDFAWVRGANYVPSYAATDVRLWLDYDHDTIDRELGYAQSVGLNTVRIFLQSFVYHHQPDLFLKRFEDFVATADSHGLKVMPVLFDSCFGTAPSLESRHMWVANPGPDRMAEAFWGESDAYTEAVVQCQDNARQVFHNLRAVMGRSAEVQGEGAVEKDRIVLLWRLPEIMKEAWQKSPPRTKRFIQGFCDGLNDYRQKHPDECSHAMKAQPVAVMAMMKYIGHMPSVGMIDAEINATFNRPSTPPDHPNQSSTFAIGPSRTASGRPILLIDPHWPDDFPPGVLDLPLDGDALPNTETLRSVGNTNLTDDGRSVFVGGQVVTTVVELTDPIRVRSIVPFGQSRKPDSRHYTDQMRLYSAGRMRPAWHTQAELNNAIESTEVLEYFPNP